jgi:biopolymer transport protein ExbB
MKRLLVLALLVAAAVSHAGPLDALLKEVQQERREQARLDRQREAEFRAARDRQAQLLAEARARLEAEQARSARLRQQFDDNEKRLAEAQETLQRRQGDLGELFGVVRQVAGDVAGLLDGSLVSAQYPGRGQSLLKLSEERSLPTVAEMEKLWYLMLQEMTESGKVVRFQRNVVAPDGSEHEQEVVRVGVFDLVSGGRFLRYLSETGQVMTLPRQPARRYQEMARALQAAHGGVVPMAVDPSRGAILDVLVQMPTLEERVEQGREVGYLIIGLGLFGLLLALYRLLALGLISLRVRAQLKHPDQPRRDNPLGRVLLAWQASSQADPEVLERRIDEAVVKEVPRLQRGLSILRILAVMAPLLGLLGTVTGMIQTFQSITLFGTGDPKLMAGGISQALVTTVLGLVVAIPLIFLHALAASRSRALVQLLEEQSAGIIARQVERKRQT